MISQHPIDGPQESEIGVQLDWIAYYETFKQVHGDPVQWKGRLLFRDGWGYSLNDYKGPEYNPPTNEERLKELMLIYWRIYSVLVTRELQRLEATIEGLRYFQTQKSAPLQWRDTHDWDRKSGGPLEARAALDTSRDVDLNDFDGRLGELRAMRDECVSNLAQLRSE